MGMGNRPHPGRDGFVFPVRRVIVGVSSSPGGLRALRCAADLARHHDAVLIAVLAWTPPGDDLAERHAPSSALRGIWAEAASRRLREALGTAWGGGDVGLTVRSLVKRGEPGPVLVGTANSADDLLVVGAGRRGPLARICHGRVSRYCLAHARCGVHAVPPPAVAREAGHGLRGWAFRRREMTLDQALREWDSSTA
jgi:nucleotide-binding universal stress UspA family protein